MHHPLTVADEGVHQAQGDQVVAVVAQLGRVVVGDVQAQPAQAHRVRPLGPCPGQSAVGEVDGIDEVAEFAQAGGEFSGSATHVQRPPVGRRGNVLGQQGLLGLTDPAKASVLRIVALPLVPADVTHVAAPHRVVVRFRCAARFGAGQVVPWAGARTGDGVRVIRMRAGSLLKPSAAYSGAESSDACSS